MAQGKRIRTLRKELGLSQEKFGKRLGVTKTAISLIESEKNSVTEQTLKHICREFHVDYFWLTQGIGEMFTHFEDVMMQQLVDTYDLSEVEKTIILAYLRSDKQTREAIENFIANVAEKLKKAD